MILSQAPEKEKPAQRLFVKKENSRIAIRLNKECLTFQKRNGKMNRLYVWEKKNLAP